MEVIYPHPQKIGAIAARGHRAPSRLVSLRQAAGYLGVSYWTVRNWVETGKLSAIRLGPKLIRIERSDLDRFIGERKDAA